MTRVVADHIDDARLDDVYRIGVDEVSYRKGHRYLTVVADHDRDGAVIWAGEGKSGATLERFFDSSAPNAATVQPHRPTYTAATPSDPTAPGPGLRRPVPRIKLANPAVDEIRRADGTPPAGPRSTRISPLGRTRQDPAAQLIKHTRWALLKDPHPHRSSSGPVDELRRTRHVLFRAWLLKEELRDLYRLPAGPRPTPTSTLGSPVPAAAASPPSSTSPGPSAAPANRILAAVDLGLSNTKLEGLNIKIRLTNHRGYGHHSAAAVIAMIYLCCCGLTITLPTGR